MAHVLSLGDSVTVGVGDVGRPAGWSAHLAQALGVTEFTNVARLGARARDVADNQVHVATRIRPALATLLVGGNDVLRGDFNEHNVAAHVERSFVRLTGVGADVAVVLLHDPRPTLPAPRIVREVLAERALAVNDAVRARIAGASGLALVDPGQSTFTSCTAAWSIDRLHPSAQGHRELARMALQALAPLGWSAIHPIAPVPAMQPSPWQRALWLACYGAPWFAKRSCDLLPELARACWQHYWRHRVAPCASPWSAMPDPSPVPTHLPPAISSNTMTSASCSTWATARSEPCSGTSR